MADGMGVSPCDNYQTFARWTNAFRVYEERSSELTPSGPRWRVDRFQSNLVSPLIATYLLSGGQKIMFCLLM